MKINIYPDPSAQNPAGDSKLVVFGQRVEKFGQFPERTMVPKPTGEALP